MDIKAHRFPVEGSSALQPDVQPALEYDRIIVFPGSRTRDTSTVLDPTTVKHPKHARPTVRELEDFPSIQEAADTRRSTSLRGGTCKGTPIPGMTLKQEIIGVALFVVTGALMVLL